MLITEAELRLIASAAIIGDSSQPVFTDTETPIRSAVELGAVIREQRKRLALSYERPVIAR